MARLVNMALMPANAQNAEKRCTSCKELLPVTAFNRATKSRDGFAPACRKCTSAARRKRTGPRKTDEMRAVIKAGDFDAFRKLYAGTRHSDGELLAMGVQNYNTARKH